MIEEDAPVNNVGSGVGVPGAGVTSPGKPANFGDTIVNPGAAKRWKKINAAGTGGVFRRKQPNVVAEVSQDTANRAYAYSKEKSQALSNVYAVDSAKKSYKTTDKLKAHITRKWGKEGSKKAEKHAKDYFYGRVDEETFAGATVFEVNSKLFHNPSSAASDVYKRQTLNYFII